MATVSKSWTFDTNAETFILADQGGDGTGTLIWDSNQYLKYTYTNANAAIEDFNATIALSAEASWESLGVPAGATVTSITLQNIEIATDSANPGGDRDLDSATLNVTLTDGTSSVATLLASYALPIIDGNTYTYDTFYGTAGDGQQSVPVGHRTSTTTVKLNININYITLGNLTANLVNWIDTIQLDIGYDPVPVSTRYYVIS